MKIAAIYINAIELIGDLSRSIQTSIRSLAIVGSANSQFSTDLAVIQWIGENCF